jgi:hypothetical protein
MAPPASGAHGTCPACHTLDTPLPISQEGDDWEDEKRKRRWEDRRKMEFSNEIEFCLKISIFWDVMPRCLPVRRKDFGGCLPNLSCLCTKAAVRTSNFTNFVCPLHSPLWGDELFFPGFYSGIILFRLIILYSFRIFAGIVSTVNLVWRSSDCQCEIAPLSSGDGGEREI